MEKVFSTSESVFGPTNGVGSTHLLLEIHNKCPRLKLFQGIFIADVTNAIYTTSLTNTVTQQAIPNNFFSLAHCRVYLYFDNNVTY